MSGNGSNKTEQPTGKRLWDARMDGQVVKSPDLNAGAVILTSALLLVWFGTYWLNGMRDGFLTAFYHIGHFKPLTERTFEDLMAQWLLHQLSLLLPFLCTLLIAGFAINYAQIGWLWTTKPLHPSLNKLNPIDGLKRLFSVMALVQMGKGILKFVLLGLVLWAVVQANLSYLLSLCQLPFRISWDHGVWGVAKQVMLWSSVFIAAIGMADWKYLHHQHIKRLMMTRQEVIDERKNQDGDPKIKQRIRQTGRRLVEKRQLEAVPKADVVINNPTHFSIAIQYDPDLCPAPRVIAKGQDHFALKIREVARANGVPMIENKPLAQSLYKLVDVDQMIPPDLFVAVAEVLAYVYTRNKGRRPGK
jgi:flagellar biosynthesis protein FlhB